MFASFALVGSVAGLVTFPPDLIDWDATVEPPLVTNVTVNDGIGVAVHFAYNVVFPEIVSVLKLNTWDKAVSLYQPANVYVLSASAAFVGAVGWVAFSPSLTVWLSTAVPPFELKETVYSAFTISFWASVSSVLSEPSHEAIPIAAVANKTPNNNFLFFIYFSPSKNSVVIL